jgi:hypothetical protein
MKKINLFLILIIMLQLLTSCRALTSNRLNKEDQVVFESEDKDVRLEIGFKTSNRGRLYVIKDGAEYEFVIRYYFSQHAMVIYIDHPENENSKVHIDVGYKSKNLFIRNYDVMFLSNERRKISNPKHEFFDELDIKLFRNKEKKVHPLATYNYPDSITLKFVV